MWVQRLRIEQLRALAAAEIETAPGISLFVGPNGAGKTTLLEAVHLLAYGRSFRTPSREVLIRTGAERFTVFAEVHAASQVGVTRLGLSSDARSWQARIDGEPVTTLAELIRCCPVVCFEPGSHALIAGSSELRRRYLDWGLFHVEPEFVGVWRRYQRALRQRNALLKAGPAGESLDAWDAELAVAGEQLHALRLGYVASLIERLRDAAAVLMPEVGPPALRYLPGWRVERDRLGDALFVARDRDLVLGHTSVGPHRANWDISYPALPGREQFSRGQEKLTALICVLAQAAHFAGCRGDWPLVALDDLGSELDEAHQRAALELVGSSGAQVWITGTVAPSGLLDSATPVVRFHVEQGEVRRLV